MPPDTPPHQTPNPDGDTDRRKRVIVLINNGAGLPDAVDQARRAVDRAPTLEAVAVEADNADGEKFRQAVKQYERGEIDGIVVLDPTHLPEWIHILRGVPRRRRP